MHLVAELPAGADDHDLARRAAECGVEVAPLSRYYLGETGRPGLLLGYAAVTPEAIEEGVESLARVLAASPL